MYNNVFFIASSLIIVANRLTEALLVPLFQTMNASLKARNYPTMPGLVLMYASWAVASALVALSDINLFVYLIPSRAAGQILTAIVCGGGANFVADVLKEKQNA
jgi:hypothetical protein